MPIKLRIVYRLTEPFIGSHHSPDLFYIAFHCLMFISPLPLFGSALSLLPFSVMCFLPILWYPAVCPSLFSRASISMLRPALDESSSSQGGPLYNRQ